jgi:hypothetical protein
LRDGISADTERNKEVQEDQRKEYELDLSEYKIVSDGPEQHGRAGERDRKTPFVRSQLPSERSTNTYGDRRPEADHAERVPEQLACTEREA